MYALVLLCALAAPGAAAQVEGEADLMLRYPSQVVFQTWGDGETYNRFYVEAEPGDALAAQLRVQVRGDHNLTHAVPISITMRLVDPGGDRPDTPLASNQTLWPADRDEPLPVRLNATLGDLAPGQYEIAFTLTTGAWDPDPDNNDPPPAPLQIGAQETTVTGYTFQDRYLWGPVAFGALLAAPFALRWGSRTQAWGDLRRRATTAWEDGTERWIHMDPERRRRVGMGVGVAVLAAVAGAAMVPAGVGFGAAGVADAVALAVLAALLHAVFGVWARHRAAVHESGQTGEPAPPWRSHVRSGALAAAQTALLVFVGALLWQQLAAATAFFRWPDLYGLRRFVAIGLSIGSIYALIAIGYTMVYGILRFINFAHGEVFTWGAYFAWIFMVQFGWVGLLGGLLVSVLLTGLLGATMERVAYRPLRGASRLAPLVTAIALSLLLQAAAQFWFRARKVTYTMDGSPYDGSALEAFFSREVALLGTVVDVLALTVFFISIGLLAALHFFVKYSRLGRAMRATADDLETARTIGIRVDRTISATFIIGSMLAAVGGVFFGLEFGLKPTMGLFVGIKAFTAAVVGGTGNLYGAFLGGFIIGLAENVGGQFIDSRFQKVITFAILVAFLLWRPQGLFGKESDRR